MGKMSRKRLDGSMGGALNRNSLAGGGKRGRGELQGRSGARRSRTREGRAYCIVNHPFHRHEDPQRYSHASSNQMENNWPGVSGVLTIGCLNPRHC